MASAPRTRRSAARSATARPHVAYWLPEEDEADRPDQTSTYELEHSHVERGTDGYFSGVARYAVRGIGLPNAESIEETVEHWRRSSEPVYA
jgi:hypothetical protein